MSDENRLIELETKLAYQEKFIEELSHMVTDQWKILDEISKKVDVLARRFSDLEEQSLTEAVIY
ncbi:SlyX family protein [Bartonella tribocorum]|uniref:SlyX protein n=1 Tax=Bartonella tribocorum (strain DSM 28219 / CCUG 45778 / CIP 105476 / IBS 506) TaxID=382640 RepID=A9INT9_BART1|nr:SlyX family protein [Bartonella tribocorum]CAK00839.1 SlyX protein [Bartonella tribocorum CIP 105476]CDO48038.1 SlyX protein [Bartonella tribocorum]